MDMQNQQLRAERDHFRREYQNLLQQMQKVPAHTDLGAGDFEGSKTIKRIQAERDQYKREMERLENKIRLMNEELAQKAKSGENEDENNIKLRRRLSEAEREVDVLNMQIKNLHLEKRQLQDRIDSQIISTVSRSCVTSPTMDPCGNSLKAVVSRCLKERDLAKGDVHRLEEERDALRERLKVATEIQVDEHAHIKKTLAENEERIRRLEQERRDLMSSAGVQKATINKLEEELEAMREKYQSVRKDLSLQRASNTQIQSLQEKTDRALADRQGHLSQLEAELTNAQDRIRNLESDRAQLDQEVSRLRSEQSVLRGNLSKVDQEKDSLLMSIDSKTEQIAKLEHHSKNSDKKILDLEATIVELQKKLETVLDECATQECSLRKLGRESDDLRNELQALERSRDNLLRENRRLQEDLACSARDVVQANSNFAAAREEVENLKRQLQDYVAEIRRVEDQLASKENERSEMLEHFRGLTVEATMLETNNHTLESEAHEAKRQLSSANSRIQDLETQLANRDSLVQSYENQIQELTINIARLETQLQEFMGNSSKSNGDVEELRMLVMKLDCQKDELKQQIQEHDMIKIKLESELSRLQDQQEHMQEHLCRDRANTASLESMLASSRKETIMQRKINEELKEEVKHLQQKVDCLQAKLECETAELEQYQFQANEYRREIKELQHQITNERFEKVRAAEESKRTPDSNNYPCPKNTCCNALNQGNFSQSPLKFGNSWDERSSFVLRHLPSGSSGDVPMGRRSQYLATPPSTDWDGLRAALGREVLTFTTEPGSPRQGACNKSCPFIPRSRPTYVTGPRPTYPSESPPPKEACSQSTFCSVKDSLKNSRTRYCGRKPTSAPNYSDLYCQCPEENPCSLTKPSCTHGKESCPEDDLRCDFDRRKYFLRCLRHRRRL